MLVGYSVSYQNFITMHKWYECQNYRKSSHIKGFKPFPASTENPILV